MSTLDQQRQAIGSLLAYPALSDEVFQQEHPAMPDELRLTLRHRMAELCYIKHTPRAWRDGRASPSGLQKALGTNAIETECRQLYRPALYYLLCSIHRMESSISRQAAEKLFWHEYRQTCQAAVGELMSKIDSPGRLDMLQIFFQQHQSDVEAATLIALLCSKDSVTALQKNNVMDVSKLVAKYFLDQFALLSFSEERGELDANLAGMHSLLRLVFEGRCQDNDSFNVNNVLAKKLAKRSRGDVVVAEENIATLWKELIREVSREDSPLVLKTHLGAYLTGIQRLKWQAAPQRVKLPGGAFTGQIFDTEKPKKTSADSTPTVQPTQADSWASRLTQETESSYDPALDQAEDRVRQSAPAVFYALPHETQTLLLFYFNKYAIYLQPIAGQSEAFARYAAYLNGVKDEVDESFLSAQFINYDKVQRTNSVDYFWADPQDIRKKRVRAMNTFKNKLRAILLGETSPETEQFSRP